VDVSSHALTILSGLLKDTLHDRRGVSAYLKCSNQLGSSLLLLNSAAAAIRAEKEYMTSLSVIEPALKQEASDIVSLLVYQARANKGIASALLQRARAHQGTKERQALEERATLMLKNSVDSWQELRRRKPDYRRFQEEQQATEKLFAHRVNPQPLGPEFRW
jgi:hypothetical protein